MVWFAYCSKVSPKGERLKPMLNDSTGFHMKLKAAGLPDGASLALTSNLGRGRSFSSVAVKLCSRLISLAVGTLQGGSHGKPVA